MEKIRVIVSIFGKEYSIASEVGPEYIQRAAEYLDMKMKEVSGNFPNISEAKIAVLAALNITDELFRSKDGTKYNPEDEKLIGDLVKKLAKVL